MYVEKEKLIELIKKAQAGDFTEELVQVVYNIAEGIYQKYDYPIDLEDFKQNAAIQVFRKVHRIDVTKQPFNYLTTLVRNTARYAAKVQHKYENKLLTYGIINKHKLGQIGDTNRGSSKDGPDGRNGTRKFERQNWR